MSRLSAADTHKEILRLLTDTDVKCTNNRGREGGYKCRFEGSSANGLRAGEEMKPVKFRVDIGLDGGGNGKQTGFRIG